MVNLKNYNFNGIDVKLSDSENYDFYLNLDDTSNQLDDSKKLISFDFSEYSGDISQITSSSSWLEAQSTPLSAFTYGLTGLDNGSIPYEPKLDDLAHNTLKNALTGSTLTHTSGDTALKLTRVTGYTGNYIYPIELIENTGTTKNHIKFCGGFYQGYYKLDGYDYQVLPNRYQKGWTAEFLLNKSDDCDITGTTLNDTYPNNKGFFFYMGTRAENKYWNIFTGNTSSGCTSGSTDFCMGIKETDININNIVVDGVVSPISVPLSPPPIDVKKIDNQFLIFGRSQGIMCGGEKSGDGYGQVRADYNYDKNTPYYSRIVKKEQVNFTNPFLIFGRSQGIMCGGEKSGDGYGQVRADYNYTGSTTEILELDKDNDVIDNAIGFRIKDDGSIGYRLLTLSGDCKSVEIIEEYSDIGLVESDMWTNVVIKWVNDDTYTECDLVNGDVRKGRFKFYLNSNLIFTSKLLNEFIGKRLDDFMEKQVGVPYNISLGGGTQGLLESMTFDGQDSDDLGLVLESNFAGTFIGSIKTFNFYDRNLTWCEIKNLQP